MTEFATAETRAVSLTKEDLADLRTKIESQSFDPRERQFVEYLTEQAEAGMRDEDDVIVQWTWTYRF